MTASPTPPIPPPILLGRLNRIYGTPAARPTRAAGYHGKYGFILD